MLVIYWFGGADLVVPLLSVWFMRVCLIVVAGLIGLDWFVVICCFAD